MRMINIKKGLDLPIEGVPQQAIHDGPAVKTVATLGEEYNGMRPTMYVKVGDSVKKGQVLLGIHLRDKELTKSHFPCWVHDRTFHL